MLGMNLRKTLYALVAALHLHNGEPFVELNLPPQSVHLERPRSSSWFDVISSSNAAS